MQLPQLNLPAVSFSVREKNGKTEIFDRHRRKYVALTPEEWVRQHFLHYLVHEKNYPEGLIAVEKEIRFNRLKKRCDIVVYAGEKKPHMIVECKAPEVKITQEAFDQVAIYNITLDVPFLVLTNGLEHYCCRMDHQNSRYYFLEEIPDRGEG